MYKPTPLVKEHPADKINILFVDYERRAAPVR